MVIDATSDCLASILIVDYRLEQVPEPFRMQKDITIKIEFKEYMDFVYMLPENSNVLYNSTSKLRSTDSSGLLKAFYIDVALGVGKELFFAQTMGKPATKIRHAISGCYVKNTNQIATNASSILMDLLEGRGFSIPGEFSGINKIHWDYACKLVTTCVNDVFQWVDI